MSVIKYIKMFMLDSGGRGGKEGNINTQNADKTQTHYAKFQHSQTKDYIHSYKIVEMAKLW